MLYNNILLKDRFDLSKKKFLHSGPERNHQICRGGWKRQRSSRKMTLNILCLLTQFYINLFNSNRMLASNILDKLIDLSRKIGNHHFRKHKMKFHSVYLNERHLMRLKSICESKVLIKDS